MTDPRTTSPSADLGAVEAAADRAIWRVRWLDHSQKADAIAELAAILARAIQDHQPAPVAVEALEAWTVRTEARIPRKAV